MNIWYGEGRLMLKIREFHHVGEHGAFYVQCSLLRRQSLWHLYRLEQLQQKKLVAAPQPAAWASCSKTGGKRNLTAFITLYHMSSFTTLKEHLQCECAETSSWFSSSFLKSVLHLIQFGHLKLVVSRSRELHLSWQRRKNCMCWKETSSRPALKSVSFNKLLYWSAACCHYGYVWVEKTCKTCCFLAGLAIMWLLAPWQLPFL